MMTIGIHHFLSKSQTVATVTTYASVFVHSDWPTLLLIKCRPFVRSIVHLYEAGALSIHAATASFDLNRHLYPKLSPLVTTGLLDVNRHYCVLFSEFTVIRPGRLSQHLMSFCSTFSNASWHFSERELTFKFAINAIAIRPSVCLSSVRL